MSQSSYAHGQGPEVTKLFATRTAQRDCAFVIPFITQSTTILDIGSGPGSITCDFAEIVSEGQVIGVDASPEAVEKGLTLAKKRDLSNIAFQTGDILKGLPFPDASFDIVFAHQLLNHLSSPVEALKEMKRLTKHGGLVAVRDIININWSPASEKLTKLNFWHMAAIRQPGIRGSCVAENLPLYTQQAGFPAEKTSYNMSGQILTTEQQREFAVKAIHTILGKEGSLRGNAVKAGAVPAELDDALADLVGWANNPEAWMTGLSVEVIYHKQAET